MLHIISNPRVHSKLLDEINSAALPPPPAVIKEGLRIFPPVTGLMSKDVPPGGDTYHGVAIPLGTKIGYSAFGLFRERRIWGRMPICFGRKDGLFLVKAGRRAQKR